MIRTIPHTKNPKVKNIKDLIYSRNNFNEFRLDLEGRTYDLIDTVNGKSGTPKKLIVDIIHVEVVTKTVGEDEYCANSIKNKTVIVDNLLSLYQDGYGDISLSRKNLIRLENNIEQETGLKKVLVQSCKGAFYLTDKEELSYIDAKKQDIQRELYTQEKQKKLDKLIISLEENEVTYNVEDWYIGDSVQVQNEFSVDESIFKEGLIGKIVHKKTGEIGIEWNYSRYSFNGSTSHDCNGNGNSGYCWYIPIDEIKNLIIEHDYDYIISVVEEKVNSLELRKQMLLSIDNNIESIKIFNNYSYLNNTNEYKLMSLVELEDENVRLSDILKTCEYKNGDSGRFDRLKSTLSNISKKYKLNVSFKNFKILDYSELSEYMLKLSSQVSDYESSIRIESDLDELEAELTKLDKNFNKRMYTHLFFSFNDNLSYKETVKTRITEIKDNIELVGNIKKLEEYLGDYVDYNNYDPKIGDRAEIKKDLIVDRISFKKSQGGKIVTSKDDNLGIEFDERINYKGKKGHNCQHNCKDGYGWFIYKNLVDVFPTLKSKYSYLGKLKVSFDVEQKMNKKIEKIKNLLGQREYDSAMLVIDRHFNSINVGDRVITTLSDNVDNALFEIGMEGKAVSIINSDIGVEWDQPMINIGVEGNSCRNKCKQGHGWFIPVRMLKRKISIDDKIEYLKTRLDSVGSANQEIEEINQTIDYDFNEIKEQSDMLELGIKVKIKNLPPSLPDSGIITRCNIDKRTYDIHCDKINYKDVPERNVEEYNGFDAHRDTTSYFR